MLGLKTYTMDGKVFRPIIEDVAMRHPDAIEPDTYIECNQKFALFDLAQRAKEAGIACCNDMGYA